MVSLTRRSLLQHQTVDKELSCLQTSRLRQPGSNHARSRCNNRGLGGYFGQGKDYKTMAPAGFHSRSFNPAEKNYPTHDKEMLAIIDCLKKFEPHLTGIKFEILTDHCPLTHWQTQKELSPRVTTEVGTGFGMAQRAPY